MEHRPICHVRRIKQKLKCFTWDCEREKKEEKNAFPIKILNFGNKLHFILHIPLPSFNIVPIVTLASYVNGYWGLKHH